MRRTAPVTRSSCCRRPRTDMRSEEHTSELQSRLHLVCRLLLEKKKNHRRATTRKKYRTIVPTKAIYYTIGANQSANRPNGTSQRCRRSTTPRERCIHRKQSIKH